MYVILLYINFYNKYNVLLLYTYLSCSLLFTSNNVIQWLRLLWVLLNNIKLVLSVGTD
jgi:hypothetical protein